MRAISWLVSPEFSWLWETASVIVGIVVAVSVLGESIANVIPTRWLPLFLQSTEQIHRIGLWSTVALIAALVLEVPINRAKDSIAETMTSDLATNLEREHREHLPRELTDDQKSSIASKMLQWALLPGTNSPQNAAVFPTGDLFESAHLADEIAAALEKAGWNVNRNHVTMGMPMALAGVGLFTSSNVRANTVALALANVLNGERIATFLIPVKWKGCEDQKLPGDPDKNPWCSMVIVMVGDHP